ncbi:methyltransferase [Labrenzia sp. OB1]|uniref:class I SAM-dependent methyltransferase n=1 Tax=Labrenzia sp. OB1 TaxID=1561204 RepID=UPI0007B190F4|nr:methyltransferase [Labrenzia sp. OB1]KZM50452.1 50S ribosomal protein L11 methyltransferase [Labrenzia sp. OB1]
MTPIKDPIDFIRRETRIKPVPHAEEIRLHVADEAMALWQKTEEDLGELGLAPPFWAFAWAGGQGLARYILDTPELVGSKRIVDFACGSGLVGIAAMMAGATSCHAVDIDPFALAATGLNAELNGVVLGLEMKDITTSPLPEADIVFFGDVFYDREMAEKVLGLIDRLLDRGTDVLVGDPGRSYLPKTRLTELASYNVPVVGALEDNEIKRTRVFRMTKENPVLAG